METILKEFMGKNYKYSSKLTSPENLNNRVTFISYEKRGYLYG